MKKIVSIKRDTKIEECPICLDKIDYINIIITECLHIFCYKCLLTHLKHNDTCPLCRRYLQYQDILSQIIDNTEHHNIKVILIDNEIIEPVIPQIEPDILSDIFHIINLLNIFNYVYIINLLSLFYFFYEFIEELNKVIHPELMEDTI